MNVPQLYPSFNHICIHFLSPYQHPTYLIYLVLVMGLYKLKPLRYFQNFFARKELRCKQLYLRPLPL